MMRKAAAIVAVVTALAGSSAAQDTAGMGVLRGHVADAQQVPQKDAAVCAPAVSQCVVTDAAGAFALMLRPGHYALEITERGQLLVVGSDIQVRAGLDNIVEIRLPEAQTFGQTVSVTAPALVAPEEVKTSGFVKRRARFGVTRTFNGRKSTSRPVPAPTISTRSPEASRCRSIDSRRAVSIPAHGR